MSKLLVVLFIYFYLYIWNRYLVFMFIMGWLGGRNGLKVFVVYCFYILRKSGY